MEATKLNWLLDRMRGFDRREAVFWKDRPLNYAEFADRVELWDSRLAEVGVGSGDCCAVLGDATVDAGAVLLALFSRRAVAVPVCSLPSRLFDQCLDMAHATAVIELDGTNGWHCRHRKSHPPHPLLDQLRSRGGAGLVLFTSGSSGEPKAVLWDAEELIARHRNAGRAFRTLALLRLDHIGGLNTLFHTFGSGGTLVVVFQRDAESVLGAIERYRIQLLPTTPTFLRMMLISQAHERYDLSSLELISYGTEPMGTRTLETLCQALPHVRFKQTYGLSEIGILPTQSARRESVWLRLGGNGVETRVVDGILWIRTPRRMLGYLNADSPVDADGWLNTQDVVEANTDEIRVVGRASELINVGGEKVYPAEVEDVLIQAGNVYEAVVYGRRNAVTGQIVAATVRLIQMEERAERRLIEFCRERLAPYQVPLVIEITDRPLQNERGKTMRRRIND